MFLSAIIIEEPRNKLGFSVIYNHATDSHSDLIAANKLRDDGRLRFARVEFVPDKEKPVENPDSYVLRIDEERTPDWFTEEVREGVYQHLRRLVSSMVAKDGDFLLGGKWVVPKGVTVSVGPNTVVAINSGTVTKNSGTVTYNSGTVTENSGTVTNNYGTVTKNSGTVTENSGKIGK